MRKKIANFKLEERQFEVISTVFFSCLWFIALCTTAYTGFFEASSLRPEDGAKRSGMYREVEAAAA
jgi:hypothetical protein